MNLEGLEKEVQIWAEIFAERRKEVLKKRVSKGELAEGIDISLEAEKDVLRLAMLFPDYGRFVDMRPSTIAHDHYGKEYIQNLEKWITRDSVFMQLAEKLHQKNGSLPYGYLGVNTYNKKLVNAMAWGVAKIRAKGRFKRKAWWNKPKTAGIREVYNIAAAAAANQTTEISQTLKNGSSSSR